jgi:hypothetical protein
MWYSDNNDTLEDCFAAAVLMQQQEQYFNNVCKQHMELPWPQALPKLPMQQFGIIVLLLICS